MRKHPHSHSKLTRHQHELRDRAAGRRIFGEFRELWQHIDNKEIVIRAPNPKRTVLKVPELRKRRSERDPEVLREQQLRYRPHE